MRLDVYVNYPGHCEEAFRFYERHLGGRILDVTRHGALPHPANVPSDWTEKIAHARIELGGTVVMGADVPDAQPMRSAYLTLTVDTEEEAERVYTALSEGGEVFMPMKETFFATRFAMLRDRFGTSWMLLTSTGRRGAEAGG